MAGNSNSGGKRSNAGRKSNAEKLLIAGFSAPWFGPDEQKIKLQNLLDSDDERIVLDVTKYLLDRIYGKATERKELTGADGGSLSAEITVRLVDANNQSGD